MPPSFVRRLVTASLALCAVAPSLFVAACAAPESQRASTLRFAVSTTTAATATAAAPPIRVGEVRVLSRHVNLQEPILLGAAEGNVTITFAHRQREGSTVALNPTSLEPNSVTAYTYSEHVKRARPPFLALDLSRVLLANGGSMSCWTDSESSRVLAQAFGADGTWVGSPIAVSPEGMDVFGAPQVVVADGRHVVAAFFASTEDGFELVAASLEQVR
jgi:hypothetical protein